MGEPSSSWGIVLCGVYSAILRGSVLNNACHGWLFDQQGTRHESVTCLVTVICHETESKEWALVNASAMVIAGACCSATIQHKMVVVWGKERLWTLCTLN